MALRKRTSRSILVDNIRYRWLVSPNKGFVVVVVQQENTNGQKIEVDFPTDINSFWLEFPHTETLNLKIISPKITEAIIRQALNLDWQPEKSGKPLVFDYFDNKLYAKKI